MFGRRIHLFTVFGFRIGIDLSWFLLAIVVTWSLSTNVFPAWYPGLRSVVYFWMGIVGALGLFASIVVHELAHSLVARRHGVIMRGITLFIFGGVAEMTQEPPHPKAEFQVAIAGPLMSIAVSIVCYLASISLGAAPVTLTGVLKYLAMINGVLVLFNMIPAFPLDGGRVLRALLWRSRNDLAWATKITARIGVGFSFVLLALGVFSAINGNLVGGIWYFMIGYFLRNAANMSYQHVLIRCSLEGERVRRFMLPNPVTVPSNLSIQSLVDDYIYRYRANMFPVANGERLIGSITTGRVKEIPRGQWHTRTVGEIAEPYTANSTIHPDTDAKAALDQMHQAGASHLLVVEDNHLVGIVTIADLLRVSGLKKELEGR